MRRIACAAALLILSGLGPAASAGLVISIPNETIPDQQATIDVPIYLTNSGTTPINLDGFGFNAVISANPGSTSQLVFDTNQPVVTNDPNGLYAGYVFFGDSTNATSGQPVGTVNTNSFVDYPGDTFSGSDSTQSGNDTTLAAGATGLLAVVQLSRFSQIPAGDGDTFTLSLSPASNSNPLPGDPTFFTNSSGTFFPYSASTDPTQLGQITVLGQASPQPTPEPSTLVSSLVGAAVMGLLCFWRSRGKAPE